MASNDFDLWSLGQPIGALGSGTGDFARWSLGQPIGALLPAGGQSYAETGAGGARGGGAATVAVVVAVAGAGGARGGGVASASSRCVVIAAGGLAGGGSASSAANGSASETGAGGVVGGGQAAASTRRVVVAAGGLQAGGEAVVAVVAIDPGPETLRAVVRWMLRRDPAVFALVGDRIRYAGSKQRDASPRITYTVPSALGWNDLDGPTGTDDARVRISVWATGSIEAAGLAEIVRKALDGFRGYAGTVWVESCAWLQAVDLPEPAGGGGDASIYQIACDFSFIHRLP